MISVWWDAQASTNGAVLLVAQGLLVTKAVRMLQMMAAVNGRERSAQEYAVLLRRAGFVVEGVWQARGLVSLVGGTCRQA